MYGTCDDIGFFKSSLSHCRNHRPDIKLLKINRNRFSFLLDFLYIKINKLSTDLKSICRYQTCYYSIPQISLGLDFKFNVNNTTIVTKPGEESCGGRWLDRLFVLAANKARMVYPFLLRHKF